MRVPLHTGWTLRAVAGAIPDALAGVDVPATVPGCVHLDLQAAGLIPDPYLDQNEPAVAWVGRVDWRYETSFGWDGAGPGEAGSGAEVDLVALGLDTIVAIELNGSPLARTQNMHRSYRFGVGDALRHGTNQLAMTFSAGVDAAERASEELGPRPHVNSHPYNAIRKMACSYGWDWGPDLVTAGIWRPLALETWRTARLAAVRPLVTVQGSTGFAHAHIDVQRASADDTALDVRVEVGGLHAEGIVRLGESSTTVEVAVPDVALWWPNGHGEQPLYPVTVVLSAAGGQLDQWQGRVGFRTVMLDTTPDPHGAPFTFRINGVPVFVRGANWIPDDAFPARITRDRYATRVAQARDAGINLLRVWGGGIYESDDFYRACDELGIMVWQDFLFACAAYSEQEPLRGEVIAEAREAVIRLSGHASLVLWNGNNESIWGYWDWDWKQPLGDLSWGAGYYFDLLPAIVAELDPTRPYCPGSPYSMTPDRHPNDPAYGTMHIWDVWNQLDYTAYRDHTPRFVSEFGFQGPPTWATLTRAIHDQPLAPDSPGVLLHQKADDGNGKLARGLTAHLPPPRTFDDWHWATSLNQARAVRLGVEHLRSLSPLCMGAVVWQLNDCWPVTSWAAIDGDGRRKPVWYALRSAYRDRLLTVQPRQGGLALVIVNDSSARWSGTAQVTRYSLDGATLAVAGLPLDVPSRGTATILLPDRLQAPHDPAGEVLLAQVGPERAWWHYAEDIDTALPVADLVTSVEQFAGGYRVTVVARTFVRDLALLADRAAADATVDTMLVTLLPGEQTTFVVSAATTLTPAELTSPLVLRSANQLVTGVGGRSAL